MQNKFETSRCIIRPFQINDIDSFMTYRNNEIWMIHQGFKGLTKEEYIDKLIHVNNGNDEISTTTYEKGNQLAIILKETNQLIGDIYLSKENNSMWLGYTIHPDYSKKGYSYETANEIIQYLKLQESIHSIKASIFHDNKASISLIKKLGFHFLETDNDEEIYILKFK